MRKILEEKRDRLIGYIDYLKEINMKIAELEYSMYCVRGVSYDRDRVQCSVSSDNVTTVVARVEDLFELRYQVEKKIKDTKQYFFGMSENIKSPYDAYVFIERFVDLKSINEIAEYHNRSKRSIQATLKRAYETMKFFSKGY